MKGFLDYIHWWKILSYKKAHTCDLRLVWYLFHREGNILHEISTFNGWPHSANHLVQSKNVLRSLRLTVILALVFFCCWVFLTLWWKGTFLKQVFAAIPLVNEPSATIALYADTTYRPYIIHLQKYCFNFLFF